MNEKENRYGLLQAGFTEKQIKHLSIFRRKYVEKEQLARVKEQRRLEFARWLVMNKRLTDQAS
jgi:hypothetical protein